MYPANAIE